MSMIAATVAAALVGTCAGTVPFVPAQYLQAPVRDATGGRVVLAETDGTVWSGSARVAFESGGLTEARRSAGLPGPIAWSLAGIGIAPPSVTVRLAGADVFDAPFAIRLSPAGSTIERGRMRLPATLLEALGAPFNTLRPGGGLAMTWDTLTLQGDGATGGTVVFEWTEARSALSSVAPLGAYRLEARLSGKETPFELTTLKGPLLMSGSGRWTTQGVRYRGEARAAEGREADLAPMIGLLGPVNNGAAQMRYGS